MSIPNSQTWQERREARNRAEAAATLVLARGPTLPPADDSSNGRRGRQTRV